ncbi:DNA polymerase IV [Phanerochaete sordida]|uniref:DNA polymerase kappa n=1 Tax=Phanerochaete sordida TaxID=48140 RepID=A0A9P3GQM7_9APHY|nr:DNA polymerase IV [Phanerochaete sordida]
MKAGLAKDQTEINKIIAEASKGSKFYENEKRKDKELTERIAKILKVRDDILREADIAKAEHSADALLTKMEEQRDLTQIIVHVDMDAFYASVELLDDPSLAGKPFAVGHGVVSTASYAARKFGVRSGMAEFVAKKLCPELIVISTHFVRYMELSKQIMDIFRRYDPTMCAAGCDEGYLNITKYCEEHLLTADDCVQEMRETVHRETKLTVSAGIAPNKMLAKICSDRNKPNGQFALEFSPAAVKAFMHDLSIRKIPGVGRVNERLLESIGIKTCGDIYTHRATLALMDRYFGLHFLLQTYLGIASNVVEPGQREERKSIGSERTFHTLSTKEDILRKLEEVAADLSEDMERTGWTGKTVTLKYKLDTYQVFTRAKSFDRWISTKKDDLFATGKELLLPELPLRLRLIGLRVTKLKDLRAEADKPGSIKRFFESAGSSPRKKRRLDEEGQKERDDNDEPRLTQDGYEDAMPGFYEHEDAEREELERGGLAETDDNGDTAPTSKLSSTAGPSRAKAPPPLEPFASSSHSVSPQKQGNVKVHSTLAPTPPPEEREPAAEEHICPICARKLATDNAGLNAHVDYCLSRSAIREAQQAGGNAPAVLKPLVLGASTGAKRKRRKG